MLVDFQLKGQVDQEIARRTMAAVQQLTSTPRPTLLRLNALTGVTREARRYLVESADGQRFVGRLAVLAETPLAAIVGKFLISGVQRPRMPAHVFGQGAEAEAWLQASSANVAESPDRPLTSSGDTHQAILSVLLGLAHHDFSLRAQVSPAGSAIDAVAAAANMLSEELEVALQSKDEHSRAVQESASAQSQFMANMSHEIRTPLTALLGFADLLMDQHLTEQNRLHYAQVIRQNGEHLLALINDLLDLSKIEAGKLTLEILDCDLPALLSEIEALMAVRARDRGIRFAIDRATPLPAVIRTDPTRLRQVLLNLIGNAIKFTEVGGVRVVVRWDAAKTAAALTFDVIDTGIGMTAEQVERLFKPFEQADSSMTRRFGGSGLGLSISKPLAEALGGGITVRSHPGEGSTFTLALTPEIPIVAPTAESPPAPPAAAAALPDQLNGTVLLAEDGPDNQLLISTILRKRGLTVVIAENGQIAVEQTLNAWRDGHPFDVILMDMQMPLLDGYGATNSLREMGYRGPILALTAHAMAGERERCFAAGCNDYLSKPIDRQALLASISRHLTPSATPAVANDTAAPLVSDFADDPEMMELVERFVQNLPHRIAEIKIAAGRTEPEALMHIAHQLKGSAGGYGFMPISEAAARLEQGLRGASPHQTPALVADLIALCQRACATVDAPTSR